MTKGSVTPFKTLSLSGIRHLIPQNVSHTQRRAIHQ